MWEQPPRWELFYVCWNCSQDNPHSGALPELMCDPTVRGHPQQIPGNGVLFPVLPELCAPPLTSASAPGAIPGEAKAQQGKDTWL